MMIDPITNLSIAFDKSSNTILCDIKKIQKRIGGNYLTQEKIYELLRKSYLMERKKDYIQISRDSYGNLSFSTSTSTINISDSCEAFSNNMRYWYF